MAVRINPRIPATCGSSCARRNTRRSFSQGVTHSLGRHARTQSINNAVTLSTNGSNWGKSLWGHYCGKSDVMRTQASKRPTRSPTKARLASVCVDLSSNSEARVEGVHNRVLCVTRSCGLIHHIHTHTHKHSNHPSCQSASECCASATPLRHVYTVGMTHYNAQRTESR